MPKIDDPGMVAFQAWLDDPVTGTISLAATDFPNYTMPTGWAYQPQVQVLPPPPTLASARPSGIGDGNQGLAGPPIPPYTDPGMDDANQRLAGPPGDNFSVPDANQGLTGPTAPPYTDWGMADAGQGVVAPPVPIDWTADANQGLAGPAIYDWGMVDANQGLAGPFGINWGMSDAQLGEAMRIKYGEMAVGAPGAGVGVGGAGGGGGAGIDPATGEIPVPPKDLMWWGPSALHPQLAPWGSYLREMLSSAPEGQDVPSPFALDTEIDELMPPEQEAGAPGYMSTRDVIDELRGSMNITQVEGETPTAQWQRVINALPSVDLRTRQLLSSLRMTPEGKWFTEQTELLQNPRYL